MKPMQLELVDTIWARLTAFYGRRFMLQFEGIEQLEAVKATWAEALAGFGREHFDGEQQSMIYPAIDWALETDNLPVEPPTLPQLREICRTWREPTRPRIAHEPKRGLTDATRAVMRGLSQPIPDNRPHAVIVASRYVALWGAPGTKLNPMQAQTLREMRETLRKYEASPMHEPAPTR